MGWQEIAAGLVVLVAVAYLVRRFRGKSPSPGARGGPDVPVSRLKKRR